MEADFDEWEQWPEEAAEWPADDDGGVSGPEAWDRDRAATREQPEGAPKAAPAVASSFPAPPDLGELKTPPSWHLAVGLLAGTAMWLHRSVPNEASFEEFLQGRYGRERPPRLGRFVLGDRSHSSKPHETAWRHRWLLAIGHAAVQHEGHSYEHTYLGAGGRWVALPYLPRIQLKGKNRGFKYGVGICHSARCVCWPDSKAPCKQLVWDASSLLSLVLGLNIALFVAGLAAQAQQVLDRFLRRWCTLTLWGLQEGRVLSVLLSPFYHAGIFEFGRNMALLATILEHAAAHGTPLFLALYIGGSAAHFFASCAVLQLSGQGWMVPMEAGTGCRGGLSSLLALVSQVAPSERFRFSLYMVEVPTPLSPLATLGANAAVDATFAAGRGRAVAELAGHAAACLWGWALTAAFVH